MFQLEGSFKSAWKKDEEILGRNYFIFCLGKKYYKLSVMIGTDTNWFLNLENPDLDYTFRCNTTRNDSNIIFAGNYPEEYYKDTKSCF